MTLRVGLIGCGSIGRQHARILYDLAGVNFVGIVDPLGGWGSVPWFRDLDELLQVGVDYCVVAVPTTEHLAVALRLSEAGVCALIEKPLADTSEDALRIVEAFEASGLLGAVGYIERFNAGLREARRRIAGGVLGEVLQVSTRRQGPFPGRISDVGVIQDLATHDIDLTAWLVESRFSEVSARVRYRAGRVHEDMVVVVGGLECGAITSHVVNWLSPFKERTTVVVGDNGAFVIDTLSADLTYFANGKILTEWDSVSQFRGVSEGDVVRFAIARPEPLRVEHEQFRDAMAGGLGDVVPLRAGLEAVRVTEAIQGSARSGKVVTLADRDVLRTPL